MSGQISSTQMQRLLAIAGVHIDSRLGRVAMSGRPVELEGKVYSVDPCAHGGSEADTLERKPGETQTELALRAVAEIERRRSREPAVFDRPAPAAPSQAQPHSMRARVVEIMRARRSGRAPGAWANSDAPGSQAGTAAEQPEGEPGPNMRAALEACAQIKQLMHGGAGR